ncbi:MAG: anti-sigma factor [Rhodospirillales bacterium]|nr:anti-sigma factor [Rhodospirillales bacterium]
MTRADRVDDVMLMAYVDGEVDAITAREIEAAIAADPATSARARALRDSAALPRAAFADVLHEEVPDRLIAALGKTEEGNAPAVDLASRRAARPARHMLGWAVAAALATLIIGAGGTYGYLRGFAPIRPELQTVAADRWIDNVAAFYKEYAGTLAKEDRLLVDFNAEHIGDLESWFGARLKRRLSVPDLSAQGFFPQGGRLLIIGGRPAAQFLYFSQGGELVGLVVAFSNEGNLPGNLAKRGDVNVVYWREGGYAYAFVGQIDSKRLWHLADVSWKSLDTI